MRWYFWFCLVAVLGAGPCNVVNVEKNTTESAAEDSDTGACDSTPVVCQHSLDVDVLLALEEAFVPGVYSVELTAPDGSRYEVACTLTAVDQEMLCDGANADVLELALDPDDPSVMILHVTGAPPSCQIAVFLDDVAIGEETLAPEYDVYYPNGEGCDPACYAGRAAMAVALP